MKNLFILLVLLVSACTSENPSVPPNLPPPPPTSVRGIITPTEVGVSELSEERSEGECGDGTLLQFSLFIMVFKGTPVVEKTIFYDGCEREKTRTFKKMYEKIKNTNKARFRVSLQGDEIKKIFAIEGWGESGRKLKKVDPGYTVWERN